MLLLPKGEKENGLHGDELVEWIEWGQTLFSGFVEQDEEVEREGDRYVVDEG